MSLLYKSGLEQDPAPYVWVMGANFTYPAQICSGSYSGALADDANYKMGLYGPGNPSVDYVWGFEDFQIDAMETSSTWTVWGVCKVSANFTYYCVGFESDSGGAKKLKLWEITFDNAGEPLTWVLKGTGVTSLLTDTTYRVGIRTRKGASPPTTYMDCAVWLYNGTSWTLECSDTDTDQTITGYGYPIDGTVLDLSHYQRKNTGKGATAFEMKFDTPQWTSEDGVAPEDKDDMITDCWAPPGAARRRFAGVV